MTILYLQSMPLLCSLVKKHSFLQLRSLISRAQNLRKVSKDSASLLLVLIMRVSTSTSIPEFLIFSYCGFETDSAIGLVSEYILHPIRFISHNVRLLSPQKCHDLRFGNCSIVLLLGYWPNGNSSEFHIHESVLHLFCYEMSFLAGSNVAVPW